VGEQVARSGAICPEQDHIKAYKPTYILRFFKHFSLSRRNSIDLGASRQIHPGEKTRNQLQNMQSPKHPVTIQG